MPRALLIVNRKSREGEADLGEGLDLLRRDGISLVEEYPEEPGAIPEILRRHRGVDAVIIGGGDGTFNSAAAALVDSGLPLGILPMGTANDLARTLEIPRSLPEACRVIADGRVHRIDLGWVNGHYFFNAAHVGLGARVTHHLSPRIKARWGILAFLPGLAAAWRENRSFRARIVCDGRPYLYRSIQIAVGNGRHYGGGMTIAAEAGIDDHLLHLYSLEPQSFWRLFALVPALRRGEFEGRPGVELLSGREIDIHTRRPLPIDTDGELSTRTPASFRVMEGLLPVFVPQEYLEARGIR